MAGGRGGTTRDRSSRGWPRTISSSRAHGGGVAINGRRRHRNLDAVSHPNSMLRCMETRYECIRRHRGAKQARDGIA